MSTHTPEELQRMYGVRFSSNLEYRKQVWSVLISDWFGKYINPADAVLDLGCGYGEFINGVACREKYGMDLNPDAARFLRSKRQTDRAGLLDALAPARRIPGRRFHE